MSEQLPCVALRDVFQMYGMKNVYSARNAVIAGRLPVSTYKQGKLIVINREVHETLFREKRE